MTKWKTAYGSPFTIRIPAGPTIGARGGLESSIVRVVDIHKGRKDGSFLVRVVDRVDHNARPDRSPIGRNYPTFARTDARLTDDINSS